MTSVILRAVRAELIGDKSVRMGTHYGRHVEGEAAILRAFERVENRKLSNAKE